MGIINFGDPELIQKNRLDVAKHNLMDSMWHMLDQVTAAHIGYHDIGKTITDVIAEFSTETGGELLDLQYFVNGVQESLKGWYMPPGETEEDEVKNG